MTKEFELDDKGNIVKPPKKKVLISSYSSGIPTFCPKCNSDRTVIFFGHNFTPRLIGDWQEKIRNKQTILCDKSEIIKKFTPKNQVTSLSNPNWVCKQCYNGGIVMSKNDRNQIFEKIEKNAESIESHKDFPFVLIMKKKPLDESIYGEIYIGMLDCIEDEKIYLDDVYEIDENQSSYLEDEYKKWDLRREDRDIEEFPHIKLEHVDEIYVCRYKFTSEQAWNVWSDPRDFFYTEDAVYQKIQNDFRKNETNFENNKPKYWDENGNAISLKEIFDKESVDGKAVTLIAVTRNQFDISKFPEFEKYIKMELGYDRCYYGLWKKSKKDKPEYEVVYAITPDDSVTIQRHLNLHDDLNDGLSQEMALVIFSDGSSKAIKNSK